MCPMLTDIAKLGTNIFCFHLFGTCDGLAKCLHIEVNFPI